MRRLAVLLLFAICVISLAAPVIAPYDPLAAPDGDELKPPSAAHPWGTDVIGRDVFSRTIYGGRQTLIVALAGLLIAVIPGAGLGVLAAVVPNWVDRGIGAVLDALLSIPSLLIAFTILTMLGRGSMQIALACGIAVLPAYARITRAAALQLRSQAFVEAAYAIGATRSHVLRRTLLPNLLEQLISAATVMLAWIILNASSLHFLGLGGDPGIPEWGAMLAEARQTFRLAPWAALAPGLAITVTLFLVNIMAEKTSTTAVY